MPVRITTPLARVAAGCALALALVPALSACSGSTPLSSAPAPTSAPVASPSGGVYDDNLADHPTAYGTLGPGYPTASAPPPPEGTFTPSPGAWDDVHPPAGYTVTLVRAAHDRTAATTTASVRAWAAAEHVRLHVITVATPDEDLADLAEAIKDDADLVMTAGDSLIDAMAVVTASAPQTRFLILGGEIAEPTDNVTAVDWDGAGYRGEGLGEAPTHDPASFTPERTGRAVRAGVAAVLTNWTNLVVWLS